MKLKGLVLAMAVLLCAANAWASVTLSSSSFDAGATYITGSSWGNPTTTNNYEFNLSFASPIDGLSSTYGYCVEYNESFNRRTTYQTEGIGDNENYLKAAWLIDTYSKFSFSAAPSGDAFEGTTDAVTISALQAAIWTVLDQTPSNYDPVDSYWKRVGWLFPRWTSVAVTGDALSVYNLYTDMLADVNGIDNFTVFNLESKFQLLTSGSSQDLLVRTSSVPLPGAAILFGSGLLGLVGLRRRQIR